jgi:predicted RNA-binding Zn ribbon-like protein
MAPFGCDRIGGLPAVKEVGPRMTWSASDRYGLDPAPGALGLVQDLLNTLAAGAPREADLLDDLAAAQEWVDSAARQWFAVTGHPMPAVVLDADGVAELRAFRDDLQRLTAHRASPEAVAQAVEPVPIRHGAAAALQLGDDGTVRLEPRGTGWRRLASSLLAAIYDAQLADTRRRLKICRNPRCGVAFYDRSRNNIGVWHDVKSCGNSANLRAYRARQRSQSN